MNKLFLSCLLFSFISKAQLTFNSLDSLFAYAERNSTSVKISTQQRLLAKWTKVSAYANTINFRDPVTFSMTDNTKLPVNFIPAEVFGGPPGTFRPITLGQQYVSNFNFNPQIDIINPYNLARVKSASLNKELTETNNLLTKKNLFESIAAAYFNIISIQAQVKITQQNLNAADSLLYISKNKFTQGIIREQDVNNMITNQLAVKDKLTQLQVSLQQQYNSLKILCDIPLKNSVAISAPQNYESTNYNASLKATSNLAFKSSILQSEYAKSELRANRLAVFPVLSAVYFQSWQQNSNSNFFDNKSTWIQSQYVGLRISVPFPPDVNRLSQNYTTKINYRIAFLNAEHAQLQNELQNESLNLDYEKAYSTYITTKQVYELKSQNYFKGLNQYKEGLLSADLMLNAFADMLNSRLNFASSQAALEFAGSKININNLTK